MSQVPPVELPEPQETGIPVTDARVRARYFLERSRRYLAWNDLHQASEKGGGAASWMVKAIAFAHGWQYEHHGQFNVILNNVRNMTGNDRVRELEEIANGLHRNYYERKMFLNAEVIDLGLDDVAELLDILQPLT